MLSWPMMRCPLIWKMRLIYLVLSSLHSGADFMSSNLGSWKCLSQSIDDVTVVLWAMKCRDGRWCVALLFEKCGYETWCCRPCILVLGSWIISSFIFLELALPSQVNLLNVCGVHFLWNTCLSFWKIHDILCTIEVHDVYILSVPKLGWHIFWSMIGMSQLFCTPMGGFLQIL